MATAKARGKNLGGFRGRRGTAKDLAKARAARTLAAGLHAQSLAPVIARLKDDGATGLRGLARALSEEGVPTASGRGEWTPAGVAPLQAHLRGHT
ncbi:hypothetical protein RSO01_83300 [Reyranella soli]|uniref:Recombinase domain-containing protein n=1 Tax=Reyranella soli TaxID=1230389 RepID=A0A512NQD8_9HYPH|nr:hypothetical protein RSO01_83300 [Reyranella soli]